MSSLWIKNAQIPVGDQFAIRNIEIRNDIISAIHKEDMQPASYIDASGLYVMPGLVDIHGDAFERQIMPRPGVAFDIDLALHETDRQLVANGITTAFHAITWSWEPGLRGRETVFPLVDALERLQPSFAVDTRIHLRHETYNLEAEPELIEWMERGRIDVLAFNDHMTATLSDSSKPDKRAIMVKRTGLSDSAFDRLVGQVKERKNDVLASVDRLTAHAAKNGTTALSHDDAQPNDRIWFREREVTVAEFPVTENVAIEARAGGDAIVFGAPNVVRGGSHTGCPDATDMIRKGLCDILASDYFYPALLHAPFILAERLGGTFAQYWPLVSRNPAQATGLHDRGDIKVGLRADLVLIDGSSGRPQVCATIIAGKLVYLATPERLKFDQQVKHDLVTEASSPI